MSATDVIGSFDDNTKVCLDDYAGHGMVRLNTIEYSHRQRSQRELAAFLEAEQGKARIQTSINDFLGRCSETCQVKLDGSSLRR